MQTPRGAAMSPAAPTSPAYQPAESKLGFATAYEPEAAVEIGRTRTHIRHDLPGKATVCGCFGVNWDEAYEFSAPQSNAWYMRLARSLGFVKRSFEGTMFDVVDELQRCEHISQLQSQQLYALVRVAMGYQYRAEKDTQKHRALVATAGLCGIIVPVVCGINSGTPQAYYSYGAIVFSIVQTLAFSISIFANYVPQADVMRVNAAKIKSQIYQYEGLAGEYSDPPDYQVQYPRLMQRLSEFRHQATIDAVAARGGDKDKATKQKPPSLKMGV